MEFIQLIASLGCFPQFIVALICLAVMFGLTVYGAFMLFDEIKHD